ncbi:e56ce9bb-3deb-43ec-b87d-119ea7533f28 [Sclerotinia trifoliorum]|uniref:E56ce9bb-3deb-43ec-b87d-119ea7533f28 n=1 Tax=Sclerotinia trifoliorum TaxID=28548 RepID=A0A8H2W4H5_9HELO|nr:e56ce9bb-3deb-43ec-b87d-119ea7533f28 [Sclerotinia trifoliorum]
MDFALADGLSKVHVENSGEYYFKEALDRESLEREIGILFRLKNTVLGKDNRIPQLYAVVQDTSDGPILGFLTHFIKGGTLPDAMKKLPSASLKHKWILQLQKTADEIHQEGIVWGDAKPDNILIDQNDNLIVLDFDGGRTEGWVEAEYMDTMVGDHLAIAKIKDMILENSK